MKPQRQNGNSNPIERFLESQRKVGYIRYEDAQVYLRKSVRRSDDQPGVRRCLDLSSISRKSRSDNIHYDPNATSTGFMARFMADLEDQATRFGMDVYVENVINGWLPECLEERGYTQVGEPDPPNFYRAAGPQPPAPRQTGKIPTGIQPRGTRSPKTLDGGRQGWTKH